MARLPADEDYARALLSIFRARKLRPRQTLRLAEARSTFLSSNMGRAADFDAALDHAIECGWLAPSLDAIRLTGPGAEEIQSVADFRSAVSGPGSAAPRRAVPQEFPVR